MPSSYQPLVDHLANCTSDTVTLTFEQIEVILGHDLPHSARSYDRYWRSGQRHCQAWIDIGWRAGPIDLDSQRVTFSRFAITPMPTIVKAVSIPKRAPLPESTGQEHTDWYWEGNVQKKLASYLMANGWSVIRQANAATNEHGIDLLVKRGNRELAVEVKGYPSTVYERGEKKGQSKPTRPTTQARHWFGQAVMSAIWCRHKYASYELAIAFPDHQRIRNLVAQSRWALDQLGIGVYLIDPWGQVCRLIDHRPMESV